MAEKKLGGAGLRGQSAGSTQLCTVGKSGTGLTYRGYDITDCLLYTSPSPRDRQKSRMPSSA